jgi:hypothetical protein
MFAKIVKSITSEDKFLSGAEVTQKQLEDLSSNLFNNTRVEEKGNYRQLDCTNADPHTDWTKRDTKTIYFSKKRLDEFFAANAGSDGLKIYLGLHDREIFPGMDTEEYNNKMMVVLVTTTGETDNLDVDDKVIVGGSSLEAVSGLDNGKLCPPHPDCK